MRRLVILFFVLLCSYAAGAAGWAAGPRSWTVDTVGQMKTSVAGKEDGEGRKQKRRLRKEKEEELKTAADTVRMLEEKVRKPHSPHKATIMAMILPGSGQLYNGQWWKVPILYGGIAADLYGICWNQKHYKDYRDAYVEWLQYTDALEKNPDTPYPENPAWDKIPKSFDVKTDSYLQTAGGRKWFKTILENRKNNFKRNRDLCYIVIAAIYAVNIIDATVFAHFYDFEIDDDLSLNVRPQTSYSPISGGSLGLALTLNF